MPERPWSHWRRYRRATAEERELLASLFAKELRHHLARRAGWKELSSVRDARSIFRVVADESAFWGIGQVDVLLDGPVRTVGLEVESGTRFGCVAYPTRGSKPDWSRQGIGTQNPWAICRNRDLPIVAPRGKPIRSSH
jgi:hypothetical protein